MELDGVPYSIVEFQHVKPGKGGAFVRTKLKNLKLGTVIDRTFRAGEKMPLADFEQRRAQYLYRDDAFHFMDLKTYDQLALRPEVVGDAADYLKEEMEVGVLFHGPEPFGLELPNFVELRVAKTDPGLRGDTASGGSKPAVMETGATVNVPLFINEGDILRIDTRDGHYIERVAAGG